MIFSQTFIKAISIFFTFFLLVSCQSGTKVKPPISNAYIQCKTPRPEVCTKEYAPVCASKDTGIRCIKAPCPSAEDVTFSNACMACVDPDVNGYTSGGECK